MDRHQISALHRSDLPDVTQAIHQFSRQIGQFERGTWVSFTLPLASPSTFANRGMPLGSGEFVWVAPQGGIVLQGSGMAATVDAAPEAISSLCFSRWITPENGPLHPRCFFTTPPATSALQVTAMLPKVLRQDSQEGSALHFSAQALGQSPAALAEDWLGALETINQPATASLPAVIGQSLYPSTAVWEARFDEATRAIHAGGLRKLVLSRYRDIDFAAPVSATPVLNHLREHYKDCHTFALPHAAGKILAASPEPLLIKQGRQLTSHALAGTTRRGENPAQDQQLADTLLATPKEREEHAIVVEHIVGQMQKLCPCLEIPTAPGLRKLRFVQHLWTPVRGMLSPEQDFFRAIQTLHPTPAVLGEPAEPALHCLNRLGEQRDAQYTGLAGWIDPVGDGEAVVILRSAYLHGKTARLWAGAGIMGNSTACAEAQEIDLKMATLLEAFKA